MVKEVLFSILSLVILASIAWIFWEQEYKYTLPATPPADLPTVAKGDTVSLPGIDLSNKLVFVHFYNEDCPCSRFNITEFSSMVRRYADSVDFVAVLQSSDNADNSDFRKEYDFGIRILDDQDGSIATSLGIYSTPQAIIIKDQKVFFKGNYNRARFCVSKNTKFAEMALQAAIDGTEPPFLPEVAFVPYGCELPSNESNKTDFISIF